MDGSERASGNSHSARELVYRSLDAADQAEVRRHAFMSCRDQPILFFLSLHSETRGAHKDKKKRKTYTWEELDAGAFDGDDEGRGRRSSTFQSKAGVVRRHEHADDPNTSNVEEQNANVDASDGLG